MRARCATSATTASIVVIGHYIDRDDMVTTVMSTFASMTVHCARCHDHKFDPISQEDYYALASRLRRSRQGRAWL